VTRPCRPRRCVWKASVSMWRDSGSSLSSQCMSTRRPRSAASSHSRRTLSAPSAIVRSKCGMPPTTSTPRSSARCRLASAFRGAQHAVLRKGHQLQVEVGRDAFAHVQQRLAPPAGAGRRRRRASGSPAGRAPPPSRSTASARRPAPLRVSSGLSSPHSAMPSSSVPLCVDPRQAVAQRRVHVEVGVDEGRAEQPALDHLGPRVLPSMRCGLRAAAAPPERGDAALLHQEVDAGAAVGQRVALRISMVSQATDVDPRSSWRTGPRCGCA
jgi:hypothetical protein